MTTIKERLQADIKDAMRQRESQKLNVLRLVTAAIKQIEVDQRILVDTDEQIIVILDKMLKQRKESIAQFELAKRDDLIAQEQYEIDLISPYMPMPLSDEAIQDMVSQAMTELNAEKISDMGRVMAQLKPLLQGRADLSKVSLLVKSKLS